MKKIDRKQYIFALPWCKRAKTSVWHKELKKNIHTKQREKKKQIKTSIQ